MSNAFEESMHQGYSREEMYQEMMEFIEEHGCEECSNYNPCDVRLCQYCKGRSKE